MPNPTGLLIGGVRLDLAVRADATLAVLRKVDALARDECVAAVRRAGNRFLELVRQTVAYDTGFMHDHVRVSYSEKGFSFEGGWDEKDFASAGLPFYPPFVELGTSRSPAQPSILPAYDQVAARLEADLSGAVARSIDRAR